MADEAQKGLTDAQKREMDLLGAGIVGSNEPSLRAHARGYVLANIPFGGEVEGVQRTLLDDPDLYGHFSRIKQAVPLVMAAKAKYQGMNEEERNEVGSLSEYLLRVAEPEAILDSEVQQTHAQYGEMRDALVGKATVGDMRAYGSDAEGNPLVNIPENIVKLLNARKSNSLEALTRDEAPAESKLAANAISLLDDARVNAATRNRIYNFYLEDSMNDVSKQLDHERARKKAEKKS